MVGHDRHDSVPYRCGQEPVGLRLGRLPAADTAQARQGGSTTVIHEVDEVLKGLLGGGALAGSGIDDRLRGADPRLGGPAQRAHHQRLPVRHPGGRRTGASAGRSPSATSGTWSCAAASRRAGSGCRTWSPPGPSSRRTNTGCSPRCWPRCCRASCLAPDELPGALGALGLTVPLTVAGLHTESRSLAEIWSALGGELKPSLDLVVTAPFPAFPEYDVGPPVTEGAAVRVRGMDGTPGRLAEERAHRHRASGGGR